MKFSDVSNLFAADCADQGRVRFFSQKSEKIDLFCLLRMMLTLDCSPLLM